MEMLSVLFQYRAREDKLRVRGPAVGRSPIRKSACCVGHYSQAENYFTEREVVTGTASPAPETGGGHDRVRERRQRLVATMLLEPGHSQNYYAN